MNSSTDNHSKLKHKISTLKTDFGMYSSTDNYQ